MKLYELSQQYENLADLAANAVDPDEQQAFRDTLEGIAGEIDAKVLACAAVYRTLEAQSAAVQAELDRLNRRREVLANSAKWIKAYVQKAMEAAGREKITNGVFTVALQKNAPAVVMDQDDVTKLPLDYQRHKHDVEPDKQKIGDALKAGQVLGFAHLETKRSVRIR